MQQQDQVQKEIRVFQGRVSASPLVEEQFKVLTRDYQSAQAFYEDLLKKQRAGLIQKAGLMAKAKLEQEQNELRTLLGNGERIKFETTTKEKEFLEEQLKAGGQVSVVKKYKFSVAVADDQLYWPYEGEYWRDELGTYQYTLTKGCIERKTANQNVSDARAPAAK